MSRKNTTTANTARVRNCRAEVGVRAFLDGSRDLLHAVGALACRQHLAYQHCGDHQGGERDDRDHHDDEAVVVGQDCGCEG